jgi:predicted enzyme related to lactoylglutathione lyase
MTSIVPSNPRRRAEPQTFRARAISASLNVKDLYESVAWYREKVGFFVEKTFQRGGKVTGVALRAGEVRLVINQDDGGREGDQVRGAGFTLQFTTAQDIDALAAAIKQRGGRIDSETEVIEGTRVLRLRDPDGFRLVISAA